MSPEVRACLLAFLYFVLPTLATAILRGSRDSVSSQLKNPDTKGYVLQQCEPAGLSQTSASILWMVQVSVTVPVTLAVCACSYC